MSRIPRLVPYRPRLLSGWLALLSAIALAPGTTALASTSHAGWPQIEHRYIQINKSDSDGTLTAVPGVHNELLGGHGSDTLNGGGAGDVLWGDYHPSGQPSTQVDHIHAGAGKDFIYASHGRNVIFTGGGGDAVHAHFGRGEIHCGSSTDILYLSHQSKPHYKLFGCKRISYKTLGY